MIKGVAKVLFLASVFVAFIAWSIGIVSVPIIVGLKVLGYGTPERPECVEYEVVEEEPARFTGHRL